MQAALARHDEIIRGAVETNDGYVFSTAGDAFGVAFETVADAVDMAVDAQRALQAEAWPAPVTIRSVWASTSESPTSEAATTSVRR